MLLGEVAPGADGHHTIAGAMDHERRHADRGQHVPDVDLHRDPEPGDRRGRGAREPARLGVPLTEALVVGEARRERADAERRRAPPRVVGGRGPLPADPRSKPHGKPGAIVRRGYEAPSTSADDALRERRRVERAHRPALGSAEERRALGRRRVEHRRDVVEQLLERPERENPVGEARAAPVEHDQPGEGGHPLDEGGVRGPPLVLLEVREVPGRPDEVDRPVADDLVRDPEIAASGIPRLAVHRAQSPTNRTPVGARSRLRPCGTAARTRSSRRSSERRCSRGSRRRS